MNHNKAHRKRELCIKHRQERYEHWLDKLMKGEATPEQVTLRWNKLQEVKNGKLRK